MNDQTIKTSKTEIRNKLLLAVNACDGIINDSNQTTGQRIQAVHALNTIVKTYLEVHKKIELDERFGV